MSVDDVMAKIRNKKAYTAEEYLVHIHEAVRAKLPKIAECIGPQSRDVQKYENNMQKQILTY